MDTKFLSKKEFTDIVLKREFGEILNTTAVQSGSLKSLKEKVLQKVEEVYSIIENNNCKIIKLPAYW